METSVLFLSCTGRLKCHYQSLTVILKCLSKFFPLCFASLWDFSVQFWHILFSCSHHWSKSASGSWFMFSFPVPQTVSQLDVIAHHFSNFLHLDKVLKLLLSLIYRVFTKEVNTFRKSYVQRKWVWTNDACNNGRTSLKVCFRTTHHKMWLTSLPPGGDNSKYGCHQAEDFLCVGLHAM
jgi:hypothetical protein